MATAPATTRLPNIKGWVYDGEDSYCRVEDEEAREMVTDAYDPAKTYKKGETRIQDNKLYRAKVDITTAEIWTPDHWEETSLETIRAEMASELSALNAKSDSDYIAVWNGMEVSLVKRGNVGFCTIGGRQQTAISAGALNAYVKIPSEFSAAMLQRVRLADQDGTPFIVDITTDGQFCLYYILGSGGPTNWMGSFAYPLKS